MTMNFETRTIPAGVVFTRINATPRRFFLYAHFAEGSPVGNLGHKDISNYSGKGGSHV